MKRSFLWVLLLIAMCHTFSQNNAETQIKYLSGKGKDSMVLWDFYCSEGMNSGKWSKIGVPSCWELQGFGTYNYGHDLPFEKRGHEYGLYKHTFSVPSAWKNKDIKIVFEGVMTDAEVKINGKLVGDVHQGAFYEFKYSISKYLKYGQENLLEVKVNKTSANESINYAERSADFWIFGGIFRPVYLQAFPKDHIERIAVDAKASGAIKADVFLKSKSAKQVKLYLQDIGGNDIQNLVVSQLEKGKDKWSISSFAKDIKSWNSEHPNLYYLRVDLLDAKGNSLHTISQRIGFRTVELLAGDGIYVNGQRIKFKGVNRHSFHPKSGRTTSKAYSIEQAKMIKDMNMNAVRMSHYPPDVHFLDVCDSLGLFVLNEVCTWHKPKLDTEVGRKIVKETVIRDVNHPSILLWDNGNESGWNTELDDDYAKWDIQQREVLHPWNIFRKTNTLHYFHYHGLANDGPAKDKIFFPTEFLHGLYDGGHGAGLEDYWLRMWNMPTIAGGFLWGFADEAVVRTDKEGILDTDGNHGADGIVGPYGEKEGSYFTIKEVWSPIYIEDRFIRNDFNGMFRIENRYHFTNLNACKMTAKWIKFDGPSGTTDFKVIHESAVELPNLAPEGKGMFTVKKPESWQHADALWLMATDPHGQEIFTWTYPVQSPKQLNKAIIGYDTKGKVTSKIEHDNIYVSSSNMEYVFSNVTGLLEEVKKDGHIIPLNNGPIIFNHKDDIEDITVNTVDALVEIRVIFKRRSKSSDWEKIKEYSSDKIIWTIHPNGVLDLKVEIKNEKRVKSFKGISFSFPENQVAEKKWLGDGPYRVWRNRMKGTQFRVWENEYNNTITGVSPCEYPEFKGFFSSLYWVKVKGKNNNGFTVYCHSPQTYLRMFTPENPEGDERGRVSVDFPEGDISFLKNIVPIGTKFQEPITTGPHGNPENFFGNDDDPLSIELTFEF
ncbi:beta-galactosidase [Tamlana fucoidanivorans]|uniref:beta-galactosidase n=1 Tax=Allotamlana fucoidanivorans TaxID=2583814 RepID=A0A5C4SQX3_9FLAO|nr:glycoside hydrolase family 2 TIM barrel-domain containing protein [Tamlana fucoidanivorans]TNJ46604.1 beta-galactosidase [Tamlana fucoidanivorans]